MGEHGRVTRVTVRAERLLSWIATVTLLACSDDNPATNVCGSGGCAPRDAGDVQASSPAVVPEASTDLPLDAGATASSPPMTCADDGEEAGASSPTTTVEQPDTEPVRDASVATAPITDVDAAAPSVDLDEDALLDRQCSAPLLQHQMTAVETWGTQPGSVEAFEVTVDGKDRVSVAWVQRTPEGQSVWLRRFEPLTGWSTPSFIGDYTAMGTPELRLVSNRRGQLLLAWGQSSDEVTRWTQLVLLDEGSLDAAPFSSEREHGLPLLDEQGNPFYLFPQNNGWIDVYDLESAQWHALTPPWPGTSNVQAQLLADDLGRSLLLWQDSSNVGVTEFAGSQVIDSWNLGGDSLRSSGVRLMLVPPANLVAFFSLEPSAWLANDYAVDKGWSGAVTAFDRWLGNVSQAANIRPGSSAARSNGDLAINFSGGVLSRLGGQWAELPLPEHPESPESHILSASYGWVNRCLDAALLTELYTESGNGLHWLSWSAPTLELSPWQPIATQTSLTVPPRVVVDFVGRSTVLWVDEFDGTLSAVRLQ